MYLMLFLRTFSQALQAFTPIALSLTWFERTGESSTSSAIRRGAIISIPATIVASRLFRHSTHQALDEALLAAVALAATSMFASRLRDARLRTDPHGTDRRRASRLAVTILSVLIVVRQTMEIGSGLGTAAIDLRLMLPTVAMLGGLIAGLCAAWTMRRLGLRLPDREFAAATRAFVAVFLVQALIYTFHELTEARLLPASEALHAATEPYGPDGIYGVHLSDLLVIAPVVTAAMTFLRTRVLSFDGFRPWSPQHLPVALLAIASLALIGLQDLPGSSVGRVFRPGARERGASHDATSEADVAAIRRRPHLLFRDMTRSAPAGTVPHAGMLSVAALDSPDLRRAATRLPCERISFASGHGLCLHTVPGIFPRYTAALLDGALQPFTSIPVEGRPSRTRTSPDGRIGAMTVFVFGENYGAAFSTRTTLVDMSNGDVIGELEQFSTWRDGARFRAADFNFWGVTFASDSNTFYATLRTGGSTYLVRGDVALRRLTVLHENVECPSLSPDNRLIAFKKRVGPGADEWRLAVLDVRTMAERLIAAETRRIDDQVEWLDSGHVLYAVRGRATSIADVWLAAIDGSVPARIFLSEAESPIVVR